MEDEFLVLMFGFAAVWIVVDAGKRVLIERGRERTRREIAAYIAEGTMTPEQGERLLRASPKDAK